MKVITKNFAYIYIDKAMFIRHKHIETYRKI